VTDGGRAIRLDKSAPVPRPLVPKVEGGRVAAAPAETLLRRRAPKSQNRREG
jgi:hypothetical protein